jgi:ABC-type transport system involved in multi-copper enzyme maturation permease subunit
VFIKLIAENQRSLKLTNLYELKGSLFLFNLVLIATSLFCSFIHEKNLNSLVIYKNLFLLFILYRLPIIRVNRFEKL